MKRQSVVALMLCLLIPALGSIVWAADAPKTQARDQTQIRDRDIYGYQLMTPQERNEHRAKMRAAKTAEERERIRKEHHDQMVARAKERGVTIPDEPPPRGPGMGPGAGGPGAGGAGPGRGPRY